ncbi:hypothetical protein ACFQZT_15250 [Paenibacillus sp. GCM10027628]|uniref:hypothetical protein n=1 Tax=Paenibacillus sp. GCM10027628 TaxID=3273413 RepID=UPI00363A78C8
MQRRLPDMPAAFWFIHINSHTCLVDYSNKIAVFRDSSISTAHRSNSDDIFL